MRITLEEIHKLADAVFPDDPGETEEHVMNAVAVILLSAAYLSTINPVTLRMFTGYSKDLISAVYFNMLNNQLWTEEGYDSSDWFQDGIQDERELVDHVAMACGEAWTREGNPELAVPTSFLYWGERERERRVGGRNSEA
jgi:hypothetical protein